MEDSFRHLRLFLWTYEPEYARNYPGFHLAADPASCSVLVNWFEQHQSSKPRMQRTLPLTPLRAGLFRRFRGSFPVRVSRS